MYSQGVIDPVLTIIHFLVALLFGYKTTNFMIIWRYVQHGHIVFIFVEL